MLYFRADAPRRGTTEWIDRIMNRPRFAFEFISHPMERRDAIPLAIILVVFSVVSFFKLGDFTAPQTFYRFTADAPSVTAELPKTERVTKIMFYTGMYTGAYELLYSQDGENWTRVRGSIESKTPMEQTHADLFKWRTADWSIDDTETGFTAKYIRLEAVKMETARKMLELGELVVFGSDGRRIAVTGLPRELTDEPELTPERASYMNSMYFDEIYHGRAAFETVRGEYPYETVHPPLGKTIITIGVELFGMTPFGWRCMGTLFGVAMLAVLYVMLKNMFGKRFVAVCGTLLLAFDFMRFTQTRIATVDTYAVFFIMLSYLFMYRYLSARIDPARRGSLRRAFRPLALSGLFFGIGAACKWIVIYAGAGLFVMFAMKLIYDYKQWAQDGEPGGYSGVIIKTLAAAALFFLVVPSIIYCLSYIPFGTGKGMTVRGGMLWDPEYYKMIWRVQVNTFNYHSKGVLDATHPYSSWWYQWVVNARPILYYLDVMPAGLKSSFAAFGNPVIWWGGGAAICVMTYRVIRYRDTRAFLIVLGLLSQLVPWMFVKRIVFAYHYFPSTVFLVLALSHMMNTFSERWEAAGRRVAAELTAYAGVLFALFYPAISGMPAPVTYFRKVLKWFPDSWPF
ncbi:MAG: phospholipid carrier-dependent glycosyltransferase [Oscillospiraceae bacterium]|nr:phospholipid carrier-dependent glycosyltransferase [Oscillospiraceae bacterium]